MAKDLDVTLAESIMAWTWIHFFFFTSSSQAPNNLNGPKWSSLIMLRGRGHHRHMIQVLCLVNYSNSHSTPGVWLHTENLYMGLRNSIIHPDFIGTWKFRPIFIPRHLKNTVPNILTSRPTSASLSNYRVNSKTYNIYSFLRDGKTDFFLQSSTKIG